MSGKRFDLSSTSLLESRDGGISKGGLVRNGFVEQDGAGERWSNARPGLATSALSPFSGPGQALIPISTPSGVSLYGVGALSSASHTSASWVVNLGTRNFTLIAADLGGIWGFAISTVGTGATSGNLSPSTWKGFPMGEVLSNTSGALLTFFSTLVGTSVLSRLILHTKTYTPSAGVWSTAAGAVTVNLSGAGAFGTTGTYSGAFI